MCFWIEWHPDLLYVPVILHTGGPLLEAKINMLTLVLPQRQTSTPVMILFKWNMNDLYLICSRDLNRKVVFDRPLIPFLFQSYFNSDWFCLLGQYLLGKAEKIQNFHTDIWPNKASQIRQMGQRYIRNKHKTGLFLYCISLAMRKTQTLPPLSSVIRTKYYLNPVIQLLQPA